MLEVFYIKRDQGRTVEEVLRILMKNMLNDILF